VARRLKELASDADVLHAHGLKAALTFMALSLRQPLFYTAHNLPPAGVRGHLFGMFERMVARGARTLFAVSGTVAEHLSALGARPEAVVRLPPLFDPEPFRAVGPPPTTPILGTLARLEPRKGVDILLEALRHLLAAAPDVQLFVGGDGPMRQDLEQRARRLKVADRVRFLGRIPRPELPAFFQAIRLYVQPSRTEGLGLAVLEAQAAGRAVVATDRGGLVETLLPGRTGALAPPEPVALAEALAQALVEADRLGAEARRHAQETGAATRRVAGEAYARALAHARKPQHGGKP